jgi:hypothetical protein
MSPHISKIIQLVLAEANSRRLDAGYGGRMDDGGASALETQVAYFNYGRTDTLPPEWIKFEKQAIAEADPDYKKYLELKKKFA